MKPTKHVIMWLSIAGSVIERRRMSGLLGVLTFSLGIMFYLLMLWCQLVLLTLLVLLVCLYFCCNFSKSHVLTIHLSSLPLDISRLLIWAKIKARSGPPNLIFICSCGISISSPKEDGGKTFVGNFKTEWILINYSLVWSVKLQELTT